jgi:hypothetical protein
MTLCHRILAGVALNHDKMLMIAGLVLNGSRVI